MSTQIQQIRIDELSEILVSITRSSEYPLRWVHAPNTRPICELYFQYTHVLIFLLMRFLSIFYRIEHCASVCVQVRLFSISFVCSVVHSVDWCMCVRYVLLFFMPRSLAVHSSFIHSRVPMCMCMCEIVIVAAVLCHRLSSSVSFLLHRRRRRRLLLLVRLVVLWLYQARVCRAFGDFYVWKLIHFK